MSIDWSKAPEDAEAGYLGTSQTYDAWYRRDGGGQVQQMCPAAGYPDWTWMGGQKDFPVGAELRPVTESQWNGEGLPPVGTWAVLSGPSKYLQPIHPEWAGTEVKIYAHFTTDEGRKLAAYVSADHQRGGVGIEHLFCPIRTAEQIAAEERAAAIEDMWITYWKPEPQTAKEALGLLWDAGYRKQVQP
ncbi:hypothetical protein [Pseudomonas sp. dw_358]|uniref:hypothetical protein n=1 Tax=Pseudomonas sp. dw_358 TaxID=2720083 RepID=UPI001BD401D9|nr:hypothetical protein [Pseudomonas sp. dw_358]